MTILAFSDIHRDLAAVERIAQAAKSHNATLLIGAGDYATCREGLQPVIDAIAAINIPAVLVHGNAESPDELKSAAAPYPHLHCLHGESIELHGLTIVGVGGAIPETPFGDWSVDHSEHDAQRWLDPFDHADILVTHSPPKDHCDLDSEGNRYGSSAILDWIQRAQPRYALCGHIHASWGATSTIGATKVMNLGPTPNPIEFPVS
jgi:Icc-related predicted phosphoesterase